MSLAPRNTIYKNGLLNAIFLVRLQVPPRLGFEVQCETFCDCYLESVFCNEIGGIIREEGNKADRVVGAAGDVEDYFDGGTGDEDVVGQRFFGKRRGKLPILRVAIVVACTIQRLLSWKS